MLDLSEGYSDDNRAQSRGTFLSPTKLLVRRQLRQAQDIMSNREQGLSKTDKGPSESLKDEALRQRARKLLERVKHLHPFEIHSDDSPIRVAYDALSAALKKSEEEDPVKKAQRIIAEKEEKGKLELTAERGGIMVKARTEKARAEKPMEFGAQFDLVEKGEKKGSAIRKELLDAIAALEKVELQ